LQIQEEIMSEALATLIKKVEAQKLQLELTALLNRNLLLFKERFPGIYRAFKQYQAKRVVLYVDPNGHLNLVDKVAREYLYNISPSEYFDQQFSLFCKEQKLRYFRVVKSGEANKRHLHIRHLNSLIDKYAKTQPERLRETPTLLFNMIITGVGLGYHLPKLIDRFDIRNAFIHEACMDSFHASLHTIDWRPILDYFRDNNRSITFCIGVEPEKALSVIEESINTIGLHSQIFTFVYQHTLRDQETAFIDTYMKEIRAYLGGLGFFDDEQTGLAHAIHNLRSPTPVFVRHKHQQRASRLILVGNGPSLDNHIDYLREQQEQCVIMSCGTALGSLLKHNIKPDIHVESERINFVKNYLEYSTTEEQRRDILFLCLHTAAPEVLQFFEKACYSVKPNDAGTPVIGDYFRGHKLQALSFSNPTVSNCGLSFAIALGFMDIHLVGVDFCFEKDGRDHSASSIYYDIRRTRNQGTDKPLHPKRKGCVKVEANFGGEVEARPVWNMGRVAMQRLLLLTHKSFPEFRCVNTNNGAKIKGAESLSLEELSTRNNNKALDMKSIPEEYFLYYRNTEWEKKPPENVLRHFYSLKEKIKLNPQIEDDLQLYTELMRVFKLTGKDKDEITHMLLRGSLNCFFGCIMENSVYCINESDLKTRAKIGIDSFNQFIEQVYAQMESDPFIIDDTLDNNIAVLYGKQKSENNSAAP